MTVPRSTSAAGATNTAQEHSDANSTVQPVSGDLRAEVDRLARLLDPVAFDDRAVPQNLGQRFDRYSRRQTAIDHATIALVRGYRRVVEDDTTVDRVAKVLSGWHGEWDHIGEAVRDHYRSKARAAVRAILDGDAS
jgi:hypothetical protein